MRIVIVGAGHAGQQLANEICGEKHDLIVIDRSRDALDAIESQLDTLTVCGNATSPATLEEAEVHKADLLVAVTHRDEVNILSGIFARQAGVKHVVVRVSNDEYLESREAFSLQKLGIDLVVSQEGECANELANIIRLPGSTEVVDMLDHQVQAVGIKVHFDSPLIRQALSAFPRPDLLKFIRFIAVQRGDDLFIPRGETQFMIGDMLYFIGKPEHTSEMLDYADPEHLKLSRVVISGGQNLGLHLAQRLQGKSRDVILFEPDPARAEFCSTHLDRALVIKGEALSQENLESAQLNDRTAFVATTEDDEDNIISCLLADSMGAALTLAQISNADYVPIINNSSLLDRAVSPHSAMINAILRYIRGRHVDSATLLQNVPGELLELTLTSNSHGLGRPIAEFKMPSEAIIAVVVRNQEIQIATGETVLQSGDRVLIFSHRKQASKVESIFLG